MPPQARLFVAAMPVLLTTGLAGCGEQSSEVRDFIERERSLTAGMTQEQRFSHCTARHVYYRTLGVWKHGGVRPGVAMGAWRELTDVEQAEIFQIAGCLATAGRPREVMITVTGEGGAEIETRRVVIE